MSERRRTGAGLRLALLLALLAIAAGPGAAGDLHHVAAAGAEPVVPGAADGSAARPWPTLDAALDSGAAGSGDTLLLAPGPHGRLALRKRHFDPPLTITSAPGGRAHADLIDIRASSGLVVSDLDVWPRPDVEVRRGHVVATDRASRAITFRGLDIRSAPDAEDYLSWDRETWHARARPGVRLSASDSRLEVSTLTGVSGGGSIVGARSRITDSEVRGFSGDGFRVFGRGAAISRTTIRDCVKVNKNHDDGIQSWVGKRNPDGAVIGITLDSNRILEWTGPPDHPLRCTLQGIGLFDGPYRDWTITNNLIAARAHHGIALYDVHDSRIVNNTVVDIRNRPDRRHPWIKEDGSSRGNGNVIVNNVASSYRLGRDAPALTQNARSKYPFRDFADPAALDYRPAEGSRLIDTADPAFAPPHDIEGQPRGARPDYGAYERR